MVPNGDGPRDHPAIKHLNLPPLGHASRGALLVTKTLLFAPDGDQVNDAHAGRRGRQEIPRARQGDRRDDLGDGTCRRA